MARTFGTLRIKSITTSTKYTASPLLEQGIQHISDNVYSFVLQHCLGGAGKGSLSSFGGCYVITYFYIDYEEDTKK